MTPNMSVNKNGFKIPVDQLEKYEQKGISHLRQFILANNNLLADEIADILVQRMQNLAVKFGSV